MLFHRYKSCIQTKPYKEITFQVQTFLNVSWCPNTHQSWCNTHVCLSLIFHRDRVTYICVNKLGHHCFRWWIIRTIVGLVPIGPLRTIFSEILIKIQRFSLKKKFLKMSSARCGPPFCKSLIASTKWASLYSGLNTTQSPMFPYIFFW